MKLGLFAKTHRTDFAEEFREILQWLESTGCTPLVAEDVVSSFGLSEIKGVARERIPLLADAIIVFGGDGTMLSVARLIGEQKCPILGVNLGSLGFLTEVTLDRLYTDIKSLIEGDYEVEERCLLQAELRTVDGASQLFHALNDVVINKAALARVVRVDAYFNEQFIASFVADGMIVSTPTGSTAYSLSAGGPIVYPSLESILITPICPHTLTNRPLIIPPDHRIRFILRSGEDVMLTIDGQVGVDFTEGDEVICTRSPYRIELVRPNNRGFFDVLREKLNWAKR
ncbi:MAG: NAD(+)/NADH kinase [Acidobacteriota bacterium]|nr:MAG: NAD(+)/NADH kinase [Acidobacteriota bacterium]